MKSSLTIIYDMTRRCPWNCPICCVGATSGEDALEGELSLERKLSLMDELAEVEQLRDVRIDFSGGEILTNAENLDVIGRAAEVLGRAKVGISVSGYRIDNAVALRLSSIISECEMTMDTPPGVTFALRPKGYAEAAAQAIPHLQRYGIRTGIQTVLTRSTCNFVNLATLYRWLCENHVDNWSLLRFYPSGRGAAFQDECLSPEQERWAVGFIQGMNEGNPSSGKPATDFHYTMKGHPKYSPDCRCVRKSIGILPDGTVTACFWAVDANGHIADPAYRLGSLKETTLCEILNSPQAAYWMDCPHTCGLGVA